MIRQSIIGLAFLSLLSVSSAPAEAATLSTVFNFIDAVEINSDNFIPTVVITGTRTGISGQVTMAFTFYNDPDMAARCQQLATTVMMSTSQKLAIGSHSASGNLGGGCKLFRY